MFITSLVTLIVIGHVAVASANCPLDEYRMESECCPACPAGQRVEKDCTDHSITKCTSCTGGTFNGRLNGQNTCSPCTQCEAGLGLKVKKSCILTSDALCEPLDGYFCPDSNRGGCMAAQRHKVCSPGQYISQTGTADKDTECLQCPNGTFSDGTSTSCQNHTKCSSDGLVQIKPGTSSTDSECVERALGAGETAGIIMGVIFVILIIGVTIGMAYQRCHKRRADRGYEPETSPRKSRDSPEPSSDLRESTTMMNDVIMTDQESGSIPSGHTNGAIPMGRAESGARI